MNALAANNISAWDSSQLDIIKSQIAKNCSDGELALFSQVCQRTGLDPFTRQIYAISRGGKMTIQVSIDGFRTIASRSGMYGGSQTFWCGSDGVWCDVWLLSAPPVAAKTEVYRAGCARPFVGVAKFDNYAQRYNGKLADLWAKMPEVMVGKCSESLALRKAFPAELSGLYSSEEMAQEGTETVINPKIKQAQQALTDCMEILGWDTETKMAWAKTISSRSFTAWTIEDWELATVKAHAEIDRLNASQDADFDVFQSSDVEMSV